MKNSVTILIALLVLTACRPDRPTRQMILTNWEFSAVGDTAKYPAEIPGCIHTDLLRHGIIEDPFYGKNELEVLVTNLWINRLVGDQKLPPEERKTKTNLRNSKGNYSLDRFARPDGDKYLRYSGLMGPVKVEYSKVYNMEVSQN